MLYPVILLCMPELDNSLRSLVARQLGGIDTVASSLSWTERYPVGFAERVQTLDAAALDIHDFVVLGGLRKREMPNTALVKEVYRRDLIEPYRLTDLSDGNGTDLEIDLNLEAFGRRLTSGEYRFHPEVFSNPNIFLARLLVEGFALDVEDVYGQAGVANMYSGL